ncbi:hypothetical protein HGRIS_010166 [Hohenbuehelia grisea]|uniref:Fungal lipase-type domain-containing protein n=1 Tax=Hohenbuehelia grisea TaxID=104357 RepID=A0ABR3J3U6_9AGAR
MLPFVLLIHIACITVMARPANMEVDIPKNLDVDIPKNTNGERPKPSNRAPDDYFDTFNEITSVTPVPARDMERFEVFGLFAKAAYCPPEMIYPVWKCGISTERLPTFKPSMADGDGGEVQRFFTGHWPDEEAIIVAHQGTDPLELNAILTDLKFTPKPLDSQLFPGLPEDILVHHGFSEAHSRTAKQILDEVKRLLQKTKYKKVYITGHSLGGALASLEALFLTLNLKDHPDVSIKAVTYGMPRVGNQAFADAFDKLVPNYKRINRHRDIVPAVPPRNFHAGLGPLQLDVEFVHMKGEIHILENDRAVACPGQDQNLPECHAYDVPTLLDGNLFHHLGPYPPSGIRMGGPFCETVANAASVLSEIRDTALDAGAQIFDLPHNKWVVTVKEFLFGF